MPILTETQPNDYPAALDAAMASWWYLLTFVLPGLVYLVPAVTRWRYILWLIPVAFFAACFGCFVYWRSIDWALMDRNHSVLKIQILHPQPQRFANSHPCLLYTSDAADE